MVPLPPHHGKLRSFLSINSGERVLTFIRFSKGPGASLLHLYSPAGCQVHPLCPRCACPSVCVKVGNVPSTGLRSEHVAACTTP